MNNTSLILAILFTQSFRLASDVFPFTFPYAFSLKREVIERNQYSEIISYYANTQSLEKLVITHTEFLHPEIRYTEKIKNIFIQSINNNTIGKVLLRKRVIDKPRGLDFYYIKSKSKSKITESKIIFTEKSSLLIVRSNSIGNKSVINIDSIRVKSSI